MASQLPSVPEHLIYPLDVFADDFKRLHDIGESVWRDSEVAFVGLARNCASHLEQNLARLEQLAAGCRAWRLHIVENDSEDATKHVLLAFCDAHQQASANCSSLGRKQYGAEFAGPRTIALAEYRTACQRWVRENASQADLVVVIDWDSWGGWSHAGVMHGVGALQMTPDAYGVAGVALIQHPVMAIGEDRQPKLVADFVNYDAWAYRLNSYWDDYTAGFGGWKHQHIPPVGSPPFQVCSAFGGMCIYRTQDYLLGTYDGRTDCEHTAFHRSIAERSGRGLFLNPSQRTVMRWVTQEPADATRRDGDD